MQPVKVEAAGSDTDSAVAMDFSDIGASPDMDVSCRMCHGSLRDEGECVVCRVEVRLCVECGGGEGVCGVGVHG